MASVIVYFILPAHHSTGQKEINRSFPPDVFSTGRARNTRATTCVSRRIGANCRHQSRDSSEVAALSVCPGCSGWLAPRNAPNYQPEVVSAAKDTEGRS